MKIIGITGGIGSGKSTVSRLLQIRGIPVYSADEESKRLTDESEEIRKKLISRFGSELYINGKLQKKLLAKLIFSDQDNLKYVNSVIHPAVKKDFLHWTKKNSNHSILAIEAAILFESGFADTVDYTVNVASPTEIRVERLKKRDGFSDEEILSRMKNQLADEERNRLADCVIVNDSKHSLIMQVEKILHFL